MYVLNQQETTQTHHGIHILVLQSPKEFQILESGLFGCQDVNPAVVDLGWLPFWLKGEP